MSKDFLYPLRRLHGMLYEVNERRKIRETYKKQFQGNPKTVFLVMTPEHENLGDHAIAYAEQCLLKRLGVDYIEITGKKLEEMKWRNQLSVMNGFPILINGGGNLGTLWMDVETLQREIIRKNPKSSIMILPNTIFYEDSDWGRAEFEKSVKLYNHHKKLYLCARENNSFEVMHKVYRNVKLIPDMVLSLDRFKSAKERYGCSLCLRSDREKTRTEDQEKIIRKQAAELFGNAIVDFDMVAKNSIPVEQREKKLKDKFDQFFGSELVITDRLHAMIFCAITGTPCVVVDSKSPKMRGCYNWIKDLDYIRFADDVSRIAEEYRRIPNTIHRYDNTHMIPYYQELAEDILSLLQRS